MSINHAKVEITPFSKAMLHNRAQSAAKMCRKLYIYTQRNNEFVANPTIEIPYLYQGLLINLLK